MTALHSRTKRPLLSIALELEPVRTGVLVGMGYDEVIAPPVAVRKPPAQFEQTPAISRLWGLVCLRLGPWRSLIHRRRNFRSGAERSVVGRESLAPKASLNDQDPERRRRVHSRGLSTVCKCIMRRFWIRGQSIRNGVRVLSAGPQRVPDRIYLRCQENISTLRTY